MYGLDFKSKIKATQFLNTLLKTFGTTIFAEKCALQKVGGRAINSLSMTRYFTVSGTLASTNWKASESLKASWSESLHQQIGNSQKFESFNASKSESLHQQIGTFKIVKALKLLNASMSESLHQQIGSFKSF